MRRAMDRCQIQTQSVIHLMGAMTTVERAYKEKNCKVQETFLCLVGCISIIFIILRNMTASVGWQMFIENTNIYDFFLGKFIFKTKISELLVYVRTGDKRKATSLFLQHIQYFKGVEFDS
jgi:hypothetical protein